MCYYNGIRVTRVEYIRLKQLEKFIAKLDILNRPLMSGFEYGKAPVLKATEGREDFDIVEMEWGFIPSYLKNREEVNKFRFGYKDTTGKFHPPILTLNAIGEEILLPKKIYRQAALTRRCLVLSSGFYEWRHIYPLNKKTGQPLKTANKYPYHIRVRDKEYFFMAGIWTPWTDKESGEYIETFAIVTTQANPLMAQVHNSKNRMPVILNDDLAYEWLFGNLTEERISRIATSQYPANDMEAFTIAKDFQKLVEPVTAVDNPDVPALVV